MTVLAVSAKTADPKTFNGSPHVIKEAEKKVFPDDLDRKLVFIYTIKTSTKQSRKTGIFSMITGFPHYFHFR